MEEDNRIAFDRLSQILTWSVLGTMRKRMPLYILLIDPDPARRRWLQHALSRTGYEVQTTSSSDAALRLALADLPLLVVADITFEEPASLRRLRRQHEIPLVLTSSRRDPDDELVGLRKGADDVVVRPDNHELLLARISAVLRRTAASVREEKEKAAPIVLGDMRIDPDSRTVTIAQRPVELSAREFRLLYTLASDAGAVVSQDELLDRVWGPDFEGEMQTVYVYISWLRKKLETTPTPAPRIVTVHGVGYKLIDSEQD